MTRILWTVFAATAATLLIAGPALAQGVLFVEGNNVGVHTALPLQEFHLQDGPDANANGAFRISTASHAWDFATIDNIGSFRISKLNTGTSEFDLQSNGDLKITGSLTTGGTTCGGGGCDRVFSPNAELTSLDEHSTAMWANGYLPAVGPTAENRPLNLTKKVGGILHELEMAHIYIEQLHKKIEEKDARLGDLQGETNAILSRLQQIEERLATAASHP